MVKTLLAGILGGFAMFLIGFVFWGTPLSMMAFSRTDDATAAGVQAALAQYLGPLGTGTYAIPNPATGLGTQLYGKGPIALVHFTNSGFAAMDSGSLIGSLLLGVFCALLVAVTIKLRGSRASFVDRLLPIAAITIAATAYTDLGQPIFNHAPWGYHIYLWLSDALSWLAAGAVIAWMVPRQKLGTF